MKKTNQMTRRLTIVIIFLFVISLILSLSLIKVKTLQNNYIDNVVTEIEKIANLDKREFANNYYEISKQYPLEIEIREDDKVIFSTLDNFGRVVEEKDQLQFLMQKQIEVENNRVIWIGLYDNFDYSLLFKRLQLLMLLISLIYIVTAFLMLMSWCKDKLKLDYVLETYEISSEDEKKLYENFEVGTKEVFDYLLNIIKFNGGSFKSTGKVDLECNRRDNEIRFGKANSTNSFGVDKQEEKTESMGFEPNKNSSKSNDSMTESENISDEDLESNEVDNEVNQKISRYIAKYTFMRSKND